MAPWIDNARTTARNAIAKVQELVRAAIDWTRGSGQKARYEGATQPSYRSQLPQAGLQNAREDRKPFTREAIQKKSRYFEKNSALLNKLADLFEMYTVGAGIQFFPTSSDPEWNRAAATFWQEWKPFADLLTRQNFDTLQGIIARANFIDGEHFILLTRGGKEGRPRLQLIESHRCATPPELAAQEGKTIIDGVAINEIGRPEGYWFAQDDFGKSNGIVGRPPVTYRLIEAQNVIHVFEPSRAGEYRGFPYVYSCINDLHDLDDLQLLEMKAARDAAEVSNVITNEKGEISVGDLQMTGGVISTDTTDERKCYYEQTVGGRTFVLRHGDKFEQFRSERPTVATRDYWTGLEHKVCAGTGIFRQLAFPESIQGTVERSILDMQATWFAIRSEAMANQFRRVWEYVLAYGIQTVRALSDPPADWRNVTWKAPRAVNVDVGRNSVAMINELNAGLRTREEIWGEAGYDWQERTRQKALEEVFINQVAAEFNLPVERIAASSLPPPAQASEAQDEPFVPVPAR